MPFNDSYDTLKVAVQNWAARVDSEQVLISRIPDFILLTETRLNRKLEIEEMLTLVTTDTVAEQDWLSIPDRFKRMRSMRIIGLNPIVSLKYRTPAQLDVTQGANRSGTPAFYSVGGDRIRLGPIPQGVFTIEQWMWRKFPVLSDHQTTNWWLENAPDALLYGALMELAPYVKDTEETVLWATKYKTAMDDLEEAADEFLWAGELTQQTDYNTFEQPRE